MYNKRSVLVFRIQSQIRWPSVKLKSRGRPNRTFLIFTDFLRCLSLDKAFAFEANDEKVLAGVGTGKISNIQSRTGPQNKYRHDKNTSTVF